MTRTKKKAEHSHTHSSLGQSLLATTLPYTTLQLQPGIHLQVVTQATLQLCLGLPGSVEENREEVLRVLYLQIQDCSYPDTHQETISFAGLKDHNSAEYKLALADFNKEMSSYARGNASTSRLPVKSDMANIKKEMQPTSYHKQTVQSLRKMLVDRKSKKSGNKPDLVKRLEADDGKIPAEPLRFAGYI